ncbi:MAG: N-acetyltransferase [Dethiobacter sp.]|jgi:phosphinothricin acetyltransferase|nr:N-acetyltransferase [Dethiobacter sp.]
MNIRLLSHDDWEQVKEIFSEGIKTGISTFETQSPPWEQWKSDHFLNCSIVAENDSLILGWAALARVSSRCCFTGVAEVSIYVREGIRGKGVGDILMKELIQLAEAEGFWTLQSGIFPENNASVKLHLKHGFREVGRREKIGQQNGAWKDILLFERRSSNF